MSKKKKLATLALLGFTTTAFLSAGTADSCSGSGCGMLAQANPKQQQMPQDDDDDKSSCETKGDCSGKPGCEGKGACSGKPSCSGKPGCNTPEMKKKRQDAANKNNQNK